MEIISGNPKTEYVVLKDYNKLYYFRIHTDLHYNMKIKVLELRIEDSLGNLIFYGYMKFTGEWKIIMEELQKDPNTFIVNLMIKLGKGNKKILPKVIFRPIVMLGYYEYNVKIENNKLYINGNNIK
jgi:hypothetical protein